jgi:hypothetical protein
MYYGLEIEKLLCELCHLCAANRADASQHRSTLGCSISLHISIIQCNLLLTLHAEHFYHTTLPWFLESQSNLYNNFFKRCGKNWDSTSDGIFLGRCGSRQLFCWRCFRGCWSRSRHNLRCRRWMYSFLFRPLHSFPLYFLFNRFLLCFLWQR